MFNVRPSDYNRFFIILFLKEEEASTIIMQIVTSLRDKDTKTEAVAYKRPKTREWGRRRPRRCCCNL